MQLLRLNCETTVHKSSVDLYFLKQPLRSRISKAHYSCLGSFVRFYWASSSANRLSGLSAQRRLLNIPFRVSPDKRLSRHRSDAGNKGKRCRKGSSCTFPHHKLKTLEGFSSPSRLIPGRFAGLGEGHRPIDERLHRRTERFPKLGEFIFHLWWKYEDERFASPTRTSQGAAAVATAYVVKCQGRRVQAQRIAR